MSAASASDSPTHPLPEKIALLVDEARWLLVGLSGVYLTIILGGFDGGDPGWSHAAIVERIANPGGRFGAWLSDLLLYLFGLSAWWWVALPFFLLAWGYHRLSHLFGGDQGQHALGAARRRAQRRHDLGRALQGRRGLLHGGLGHDQPLARCSSMSTAGSFLPSRNSRKAPPAVEM